ncbi:hypothetical protein ACHAPJ_008948 [Fusarium lateritium]
MWSLLLLFLCMCGARGFNIFSFRNGPVPGQKPLALREGSSHTTKTLHYTRVEQNDTLCEARGRQWTGKVPVLNGNGLFYWYFESLSFPERAPTVVFLAGEVAGSGFSKTSKGVPHALSSTEEVALDINRFLHVFVHDVFPELKGREFHILGESFGGFLVPAVAQTILDEAIPERPDIQLESIIMSSPLMDYAFTSTSYYDILCAQEEKYLNTTECAAIARLVPVCESLIHRCNHDGDEKACDNGGEVCETIASYWYPPEKNVVHLKKPCVTFPTCSPYIKPIEEYMNDPEVQKRLGLQDDDTIEFKSMDMAVNLAFTKDMRRFNASRLIHLLDNTDLRILIRGGELDPDTPRIGNERTADSLVHMVL